MFARAFDPGFTVAAEVAWYVEGEREKPASTSPTREPNIAASRRLNPPRLGSSVWGQRGLGAALAVRKKGELGKLRGRLGEPLRGFRGRRCGSLCGSANAGHEWS